MPSDPDAYVDAVIRAREFGDRMWREVVPEARRRLYFDALLSAQAKTAAGALREERRTAGGGWDSRDDELTRMAAALALVIAERPELITGEDLSRRRPAADVIAEHISRWIGSSGMTIGQLRDAGAAVLAALEEAGWEVTRRADRFATIADGGRRVRIPTRGRCRACYLDIERTVEVNDGEVLIDHWRHVDARAPHRDDVITDVEES